jgi:hypothetical protein
MSLLYATLFWAAIHYQPALDLPDFGRVQYIKVEQVKIYKG